MACSRIGNINTIFTHHPPDLSDLDSYNSIAFLKIEFKSNNCQFYTREEIHHTSERHKEKRTRTPGNDLRIQSQPCWKQSGFACRWGVDPKERIRHNEMMHVFFYGFPKFMISVIYLRIYWFKTSNLTEWFVWGPKSDPDTVLYYRFVQI